MSFQVVKLYSEIVGLHSEIFTIGYLDTLFCFDAIQMALNFFVLGIYCVDRLSKLFRLQNEIVELRLVTFVTGAFQAAFH
ncbi:MAG: hypothetical protein BWY75_01701 [bacterium ADurb.Bin425]|nr:MAG: hypothetical protein BWY75_01701 [bacterium ADurb.Bin425]